MNKKIIVLFLCVIGCMRASAQLQEGKDSVVINWDEDTTKIQSIQDILNERQGNSLAGDAYMHNKDVWGRRTYFNISYHLNSSLSLGDWDDGNKAKGFENNQRFDKTYWGNRNERPKYKSSWGLSIQWGKNYALHKKPIANIVQFYLDYTWVDLGVNHFNSPCGDDEMAFNSANTFAYTKDNKTETALYTPYDLNKYVFSYGMEVGPSVTVTPFAYMKNIPALHYLKLNFYYHIGYAFAFNLMKYDEDKDANQATDGNSGLKDSPADCHATMKNELLLDWGHGLTHTIGLNLTWKFIGLGWDIKFGSSSYKPIRTDNFSSETTTFKHSTSRLYLQFRF